MHPSQSTLEQLRSRLGPAAIDTGSALVYHADCFDVLARIPHGSIPLTLTSPPFNIGMRYEPVRLAFEGYAAWLMRLLDELHRVTTPDGALWIELPFQAVPGRGMCVPVEWDLYRLGLLDRWYLVQAITWCYEAGGGCYSKRFPARSTRLLFLVKDPNRYTFNGDDVRVPSKYPPRVVSGKNGVKSLRGNPLGKLPPDHWAVKKVTSGRGRSSRERVAHPCQMPLTIAERIIRVSTRIETPKAVVFDPFGGSGSTGVAATAADRAALLIEREDDYVDLIGERLQRGF